MTYQPEFIIRLYFELCVISYEMWLLDYLDQDQLIQYIHFLSSSVSWLWWTLDLRARLKSLLLTIWQFATNSYQRIWYWMKMTLPNFHFLHFGFLDTCFAFDGGFLGFVEIFSCICVGFSFGFVELLSCICVCYSFGFVEIFSCTCLWLRLPPPIATCEFPDQHRCLFSQLQNNSCIFHTSYFVKLIGFKNCFVLLLFF